MTTRCDARPGTPDGTRQDAQRAWAADQEAQVAVASAQAGLTAARQRLDVIAAGGQALADLQTVRLNLG
jgi:hypothetical protein